MAGYLNPVGSGSSVRILPANRSLVTADSRYRNFDELDLESPYDFNAKVSAAIVGKEILYQKLYWNQPLYSHNNSNNELFFQINNDPTVTYVVYAPSFTIFTAYDGNPAGTTYQPPQIYSYADGMRQAFNGDVRLASSNLILANLAQPNPGNLYDANGFQMTVKFLYSPSRGFVITFEPSTNPLIPIYSLLLLPCNYIAKAHFVHGFGIFDPTASTTDFVPRNMWTSAYFSDDTPNLLPTRYVTIRSDELTKDRRMISFQNANTSRFQNELAIIALNPIYSGTFHTESVGDDSTVISKRDDYQPSSFRMQIVAEDGGVIECDDPISALLGQLGGSNIALSYLPGGSNQNRGNPLFTNYLLFGRNLAVLYNPYPPAAQALYVPLIPTFPVAVTNGLSNPLGPFPNPPINNFMFYNVVVPLGGNNPSDFFFLTSANLVQSYAPLQATGTSFADAYICNYLGIGQNYVTLADTDYVPLAAPYNTPQPHAVTQFMWDSTANPTLGIALDLYLNYFANISGVPVNTRISFACFVYSPELGVPIGWTSRFNNGAIQVLPPADPNEYLCYGPTFPTSQRTFSFNPVYCTPGTGFFSVPRIVTFGIVSFLLNGVSGRIITQVCYGNTTSPPPGADPNFPSFRLNTQKTSLQTQYIPTAQAYYNYGNPQADALCEELIHEIAVVLDKN